MFCDSTFSIYVKVFDEETRHEEAIEAAKDYYITENNIDCDKLRAHSFRFQENPVSIFQLEVVEEGPIY